MARAARNRVRRRCDTRVRGEAARGRRAGGEEQTNALAKKRGGDVTGAERRSSEGGDATRTFGRASIVRLSAPKSSALRSLERTHPIPRRPALCARRRTADAAKRWQQPRAAPPRIDRRTTSAIFFSISPAPVGRVGAGSAADIVASRVRFPRAPKAARSEVSRDRDTRPALTAATPVPWRVPTRRRSRADPRAERGVVAAGGVGISPEIFCTR